MADTKKKGDAAPRPGKTEVPVICLTTRCNHRCIFCSRDRMIVHYGPKRIRSIIARFKDSICFEGGEPTLEPSVFKWLALAKKEGVRERVLVTNATGLEDPAFARKFIDAGTTLFNINLPAHNAALYDAVTRTKGQFPLRVAAVKNLIKLAGPERIRITLVVNSIILPCLEDYVRFVLREFPGLFYLEMNMIKPLGCCAYRPWLRPSLTDAAAPMARAFRLLEKGGLKFITDGFPLCFLKGFEHKAIDAQDLASGRKKFSMGEKANCPPCGKCSLLPLCPGPRRDYVEKFGYSELRPSRLPPAAVIARMTPGRGGAPGKPPRRARR